VAVIETEAGKAAETPAPAAEEKAAEAQPAEPAAEPSAAPTPEGAPQTAAAAPSGSGKFVSPVVRRIADEHGIDPGTVPGSGAGGRVTKKDILRFIEQGGAAAPAATTPAAPAAPAATATAPTPASQPDAPVFSPGARVERVAMTQMRKIIAEHMIASRRTSAHVHSVFEVDMTRIVALRKRYRGVYLERHGVKLTFTPFFVRAVCDGLRAWPVVNSSIEGTDVIYKKDINVGIAVALEWGLIVPVIRGADELSMVGLSRKVNDLAERARTKKLSPDEVQDGTFTITNPGVFGGLYGLPIINQPQVAILGLGGIEKRPVVIDDAIAIRSMMYMSMSYDHRIVDGASADQFLARVKQFLESFDEALL